MGNEFDEVRSDYISKVREMDLTNNNDQPVKGILDVNTTLSVLTDYYGDKESTILL